MEEKRVQELAAKAVKVRRTALEAIEAAHSGHVGGSFSVADILTVLYWEKMNINPEQPKDPDRDRFVLSKGHCPRISDRKPFFLIDCDRHLSPGGIFHCV